MCLLLGQLLFLPPRGLPVTQLSCRPLVWKLFTILSTRACSSIFSAPTLFPRMPRKGRRLLEETALRVWFSHPALGGSTGVTGNGTATLSLGEVVLISPVVALPNTQRTFGG